MRNFNLPNTHSSLIVCSGGQTGVDRAALDAAVRSEIAICGWCPKGRRSDDGCIPPKYILTETPKNVYNQRTEWNVRDSDGTLILYKNNLMGGTEFTYSCTKKLAKKSRLVDVSNCACSLEIANWIRDNELRILNVAGPRERHQRGIYQIAYNYLLSVFTELRSLYTK